MAALRLRLARSALATASRGPRSTVAGCATRVAGLHHFQQQRRLQSNSTKRGLATATDSLHQSPSPNDGTRLRRRRRSLRRSRTIFEAQMADSMHPLPPSTLCIPPVTMIPQASQTRAMPTMQKRCTGSGRKIQRRSIRHGTSTSAEWHADSSQKMLSGHRLPSLTSRA